MIFIYLSFFFKDPEEKDNFIADILSEAKKKDFKNYKKNLPENIKAWVDNKKYSEKWVYEAYFAYWSYSIYHNNKNP